MDIEPTQTFVDSEAVAKSLRAALRVEPSPEFLARVRRRIAEEPAPSGWTLRWIAGLAAAAALILVTTIVASRMTRPQPPTVAATSPRPVTAAPVVAKPVESSPTPPLEAARPPAVAPHVRSAAARPPVPDTTEDEALRDFVNAVDRGAITLAVSPVARSEEERTMTIPDLAISPISISALVVDPIAQ
jgi:hypothetical protein